MIYNILTNKKRSIFRVDYPYSGWSKSYVDAVESDIHIRFNQILKDYLHALLWTEIDNNEDALDLNYDIDDINHDTVTEQARQIERFIREAKAGDYFRGVPTEMIGHDIALSRNRHGAGFFDRGYEWADALQDIAEKMGEINAYVGDDGLIYVSGG